MPVLSGVHIPELRIREIEGNEMLEFYRTIRELGPGHQNLALTVLEGESRGDKALVSDGRLVWESTGGGFFSGCLEEIKEIRDSGVEIIGGRKVFCELLGREKKLVVCGGGHVSVPIIRMGLMIGCQVTVLEDRPKFADNARRAGASRVICETFGEGLEKIEGDEDTFFVIVTRGHRYDQICLEKIVRKRHAYIGMMGSRKRTALVKEQIIADGGDPEVIGRVHTPIGLDIGAETPEEIAVSVMAEIIAVKNRGERRSVCSGEFLRAVLREDCEKAVATIVGRRGSAPRGVGTKMVVFPDGECVGTIGGGCVEADIVRRALSMIRNKTEKAALCRVDMTGREAEDEGMVCGGAIDVLLEVV